MCRRGCREAKGTGLKREALGREARVGGRPQLGDPAQHAPHPASVHPGRGTEVPSLREHLRDGPERLCKDQPRVLVRALEKLGFTVQTSPLPKGQPPLPPGSMATEVALLTGRPPPSSLPHRLLFDYQLPELSPRRPPAPRGLSAFHLALSCGGPGAWPAGLHRGWSPKPPREGGKKGPGLGLGQAYFWSQRLLLVGVCPWESHITCLGPLSCQTS